MKSCRYVLLMGRRCIIKGRIPSLPERTTNFVVDRMSQKVYDKAGILERWIRERIKQL